jgi:hypothetical protein
VTKKKVFIASTPGPNTASGMMTVVVTGAVVVVGTGITVEASVDVFAVVVAGAVVVRRVGNFILGLAGVDVVVVVGVVVPRLNVYYLVFVIIDATDK